MSGCDDIRAAVHRYIDGELSAAECVEFEVHLDRCPACRADYEQERAIADTIRGARPLYEPPSGSLERAQRLVQGRRRAVRWYAAAAAALLCALGGWAAWSGIRAPAESGDGYRAFAADSHLRFARGRMPLDLRASDPKEISGWLGARVPFHLEIPNYPEPADGPAPYELVGTRLLQYGSDDVAYLSYTMNERPISLLVAAGNRTAPAGGRIYESGGLDFHFYSYKGLKMIAWVDLGLSYVLVSELDVEGAESCVVCHGDAAERQKFRHLNPVY